MAASPRASNALHFARWRGVVLLGVLGAWLAAHLGGRRLGLAPTAPAEPVADAARARSWRRPRGAPGAAPDEPPVPANFLRAEPTAERARARWQQTLRWRADERVDVILSEPNAVFYALKAHYPHYLHLPDKEGHLTYWELPGRLNLGALKKLGVDPSRGYRHYVWHTEYTWQLAAPKEGAQATVLFDAAGFGWDQLSFELLELIKRIVYFTNQVRALRRAPRLGPARARGSGLAGRLAGAGRARRARARAAQRVGVTRARRSVLPRPPQHYPHRAARIIVLNTPAWYGALHSMLKPIMSDVCETKLVFLSPQQVAAGDLTRWIDAANLPAQYGGKSRLQLGESRHEKAMRAFVDKANRRAGVRPVQPLAV